MIAIIAVAAVGGVAVYVSLGNEDQSSKPIKIGFLGDLDGVAGKPSWQAVQLAVEEINVEGGILGRQVELIGGDHDGGADAIILTNALTKLITNDNVDFIVGGVSGQTETVVQNIIAQHKIICISGATIADAVTQRVLDDYDRFKYYFSTMFNATCGKLGMTDSMIHIRELTGFN
ncbi:MAG: ABC transporter substrate-binding protein, partial [Candidatus Bathyarchaeota archaeon]